MLFLQNAALAFLVRQQDAFPFKKPILQTHLHLSTCIQIYTYFFTDWLKAAEAFETMALFTFLGAIVTAAIYAFIPDYENDMRILGAALGLISITGDSQSLFLDYTLFLSIKNESIHLHNIK